MILPTIIYSKASNMWWGILFIAKILIRDAIYFALKAVLPGIANHNINKNHTNYSLKHKKHEAP